MTCPAPSFRCTELRAGIPAAKMRDNRTKPPPPHDVRLMKDNARDSTAKPTGKAGGVQPPARSVRIVPVPDQGIDAVFASAIPGPFPRHVHRRCIVGLVDAGERVITMDGSEHRIRTGELFVIPPGQGHTCRAGGEAHGYRLLCLPAGVHPGLDAVRTPRVDSPQAARLMRDFYALLPINAGGPFPRMSGARHTDAPDKYPPSLAASTLPVRERLLHSLLDAMAREADVGPLASPEPPHDGVERAVRAILDDPAAPHGLDDLSAVARLSKFHLHRQFVSDTGVSPADFRLHCRMGLALELLAKGIPLAETALACGFADQSHFTKAFSRAVGSPPGRFVRDNPPTTDRKG